MKIFIFDPKKVLGNLSYHTIFSRPKGDDKLKNKKNKKTNVKFTL